MQHVDLDRPAWISGRGTVSPFGRGVPALARAVAEGRRGLSSITRFALDEYSTHIGAVVPDAPIERELDACVDYALDAAREACVGSSCEPARRAVVMGSSTGEHDEGLHRLTEIVADAIDARGPRITISTACASSTNAIGLALDLLRWGMADEVIAGGTDRLTAATFAGFDALGLLARDGCEPFGEALGTSLGEGAAFFRLTRERTGAATHAITGYGLSADAYHATSPDPTGGGVSRAVSFALADAGVASADVGYVNLHGTGTANNDEAEWRGVERAVGCDVAVSSSKGMLGHAQGAAGALELLVTLLCLEKGTVPPNLGAQRLRPRAPATLVTGSLPVRASVRHAICNSSAFGGANAAVVVSAVNAIPHRRRIARPVHIVGFGAVTPHGGSREDLRVALRSADGGKRRVPPLPESAMPPDLDPRGCDPAARFLACAVARALDDARIKLRGAARERSGLFVATPRVSPSTAREYRRSIAERGVARLSVTAFSRMVLNASTGTSACAHDLRGPTTTLTTGRGSGLVAIAYAALTLATRTDVDLVVAGGVDEASDDDDTEGAAVVVISPESRPGSLRIAGHSIAGPGQLDRAIRWALSSAACDDAPSASVLAAEALASGAVLRLIAASLDGVSGPLLVTESSESVSCAIVLVPSHG